MNDQPIALTTVVQQMIAYHYARMRQLWTSIDALTDEQFIHDDPYSTGSIRNHLVHNYSTDRRWLARVFDQPVPDRLEAVDYSDRASVRALFDILESEVLRQVGTLTVDQLQQTVKYDIKRQHSGRELVIENTRWQILLHVVNHGTDHRAQILRLLYGFGVPTFEQDYILWLWDQAE